MIETKHRRILLHLDILGFKDMVTTNSLEELVNKIQKNIQNAIQKTKDDINESWKDNLFVEKNPVQDFLWFSDTIVFYSRSSSGLCLMAMAELARELLAQLMMNGIPVRGSIVEGEFHVEEGIIGTYVGEALIRAYEMEQKQDWCGVMVDPDIGKDMHEPDIAEAIKILKKAKTLVSYQLPFKDGPVNHHAVIAWPSRYAELVPNPKEALFDHMTKWIKGGKSNWRALRKINATQEFLNRFLDKFSEKATEQ